MAEVGRPTTYKPEYCKMIVDFFDVPHTKEIIRTKTDNKGGVYAWTDEVANTLPTLEKFAPSIGTHRDTLREWVKNNPEFSAAYKAAKNLQKDMIVDLGTRGLYNPTFTIFVAKNITDMTDKVETTHTFNNLDAKTKEIEKFFKK